jgi:hypothetical protein
MKVREATITALNRRVQELEREVAAIEQTGRQKVQKPSAAAGPEPMARWSFDTDARDAAGSLHGTLHGGATVSGGRLRLDGKAAFLRTAPLDREVKTKTLEAWVALQNLTQRGGEYAWDGRPRVDAIVFGERQPGKWMAGSENYRLARLTSPAETAKPDELIHVAASYEADGRITVYRGRFTAAGTSRPAAGRLRTYAAKVARSDGAAAHRVETLNWRGDRRARL